MNNGFEQAIGRYLDGLAAIDGMFASVYKSKGKDIPDCCNFIIAEVKKTKRVGFADEEIYGMAKHYFEEADIKPYKEASEKCNVVVNSYSEKTFENAVAVNKPASTVNSNVMGEKVYSPAGNKPAKRTFIDECQLSLF